MSYLIKQFILLALASAQSVTEIPFLNFSTSEPPIVPNATVGTTSFPTTASPTTGDPTQMPTASPTLVELRCINHDLYDNDTDIEDALFEYCPGYCGTSRVETIPIGQEIELCEEDEDEDDHDSSMTPISLFMFSTTDESMDHDSCTPKEDVLSIEYGCGIPWLCAIIESETDVNNETDTNCAHTSVLQNSLILECDYPSIEEDEHKEYPLSVQYTEYQLTQFCCEDDSCNADITHEMLNECGWENGFSDGYDKYNTLLYECSYGEDTSINNRYQTATKCGDHVDYNDYEDTCSFLISFAYTIYGCQCKASYATGHDYDTLDGEDIGTSMDDFATFFSTTGEDDDHNNDDPHLIEILIASWMETNLINITSTMQEYGCASFIECNNDNDRVYGGLLNIEQILYEVNADVFIPHGDYPSYILYVENAIIAQTDNTNREQIYVAFSEEDEGDEDPSEGGRRLKVQVIYLDPVAALDLFDEWTDDNTTNMTEGWFGDGSIIHDVDKININDTLQYYGSDPWYYVPERDEEAAFIAAIVLACVMGVTMLAVVLYCNFKN